MSKNGFEWVTAPSELAKALIDYGRKVDVALYTIASKWGQDVQDEARRSAGWIDRTGNARSGIFYAVDGLGMGTLIGTVSPGAMALMSDTTVESGSDDVLIVTVGHTVFYGKFLELSGGGKNAIILSTMEKNLPRLDAVVQALFKG